jgi:hypothetical protein
MSSRIVPVAVMPDAPPTLLRISSVEEDLISCSENFRRDGMRISGNRAPILSFCHHGYPLLINIDSFTDFVAGAGGASHGLTVCGSASVVCIWNSDALQALPTLRKLTP